MRTVALLLSGVVLLALAVGCTQPAPTPAPPAVYTMATVAIPSSTAGPTPASAISSEQAEGSKPAAVTTSQPRTISPGNGVWVRVASEGGYTGTIGIGGRVQVVNGTGEHFYQVPAARTGIVDITIQNQDTSGRVMSVEVFSNGEMVGRETIKTPKGALVMAVNLKTAGIPNPTLPAPANVTITPQTTAGQVTPQSRQATRPGTIPRVVSLSCNPQQKEEKKVKTVIQISDCVMGTILPKIAGDPTYGLNGSTNSRLSGFSDGELVKARRESTENAGAVDYCTGTIPAPYWNWLECKAILEQGVSQRGSYEVTLSTSYQGLKIPVRSSVETFEPNRQYPYTIYIPIKSDQVERVTTFEFGFVQIDQ
jgi:hypothetical protein